MANSVAIILDLVALHCKNLDKFPSWTKGLRMFQYSWGSIEDLFVPLLSVSQSGHECRILCGLFSVSQSGDECRILCGLHGFRITCSQLIQSSYGTIALTTIKYTYGCFFLEIPIQYYTSAQIDAHLCSNLLTVVLGKRKIQWTFIKYICTTSRSNYILVLNSAIL